MGSRWHFLVTSVCRSAGLRGNLQVRWERWIRSVTDFSMPIPVDGLGADEYRGTDGAAGPMSSRQPNTVTRAYADTVASRSASSQSTLRLGVTTEDVRAMWVEPTDSHWEEPGKGVRAEVWSYGKARELSDRH
jgi:hypothetical protein